MNTYPLFTRREITDLDGIWKFRFISEEEAPALKDFSPKGIVYDSIETVPGCFDATQQLAGKRGIGVYRRTFCITKSGRHIFSCGGFLLAARVFIDGVEIGFTDQPYSKEAFEFEADAGEHEIIIACDNRFSATPMWEPFYDFYAYGGIIRHTDIMDIPAGAIQRAAVFPLDLEGNVKVAITFDSAVFDGDIALSISFDGGDAITKTVKVSGGKAALELAVPNPTLWSTDAPNLHTIAVATENDAIVERFGIRTLEAKNKEILLNGKPVKLLGYNRHESDADLGPALGPQQHLQDLKLLKEMNCNFIRGCHYPQHQGFLDLCDEMGFLVWEEALSWGNKAEHLGDPIFSTKLVEATATMVRTSINHPSVILWGFLNESHSDTPESYPLIKKLSETIRENDPSRLVTFASNRYEKDICLEFADVLSFNIYPGWYDVGMDLPYPLEPIEPWLERLCAITDQPKNAGKPLIVSEIGGAAIYGCHDRIGSQWTEEYQARLLRRICEDIVANDAIAGLALWMFADSRTYVCGQMRPRGFNNKGTLDEYRRPKLAFDDVKEVFGNYFSK